jgi:hypothetical protein
MNIVSNPGQFASAVEPFEIRKEKIIALWNKGLTGEAIAKKLGITKGSVLGCVHRNRDRVVAKTQTSPIHAETPKTLKDLEIASALWKEGKSKAFIADAIGRKFNTFESIVKRNRGLFPRRMSGGAQKSHANKRAAAPKKRTPIESFLAVDANDRRDLTQYQLPGVEPVPFWQLTSRHCHFPLIAFEVKAGPYTPCCGAHNDTVGSYCAAHAGIVYRRDAA